jgi:AraC family transcriptional regulator, ethanolamine operon transcriptional activator
MTFRLDVFNDFHLHGASAPEWNQRYLQLSPGIMQSALTEATSGNVHVFRKRMTERVVQQGCLPAGKLCFAVLNRNTAGIPRMQGHELREDSLFVLRSGEEFTLQRPRGMDLLAVTFESEDFRHLLDEHPWPAQSRALLSRSALRVPVRSLHRLRRGLLSILEWPSSAGPAGAAMPDRAVAHLVFEALYDVYCHATGTSQALASASAAFVVSECHRIVEGSPESPPDIDALCRRLRTSRRSLQNSFKQVADTTPVQYLRSLRLNVVRNRLMSTHPAELNVSQAATDQGFVHLSHFTERYRTLFGELPSQTFRLRRTTPGLVTSLGNVNAPTTSRYRLAG